MVQSEKQLMSKSQKCLGAAPILIIISAIPIVLLLHFSWQIPVELTVKPEFEMEFFQTLISAFAILFALLIVAIELLYPHRLIKIRDVLFILTRGEFFKFFFS